MLEHLCAVIWSCFWDWGVWGRGCKRAERAAPPGCSTTGRLSSPSETQSDKEGGTMPWATSDNEAVKMWKILPLQSWSFNLGFIRKQRVFLRTQSHRHNTSKYLRGRPVPAEVLRVGVIADVVSLTLRTSWAESQTVAVSPHFLHLQYRTHFSFLALSLNKSS